MKKMIIIWIIMAFAMVGTLTYIGFKFEEKVKDYQALENDIIESAQIYMELNDLDLDLGESLKLKTSKLIEDGYLKGTDVDEDTCDGYVVVKKGIKDFEYNAFIKCENYTTVDYE